MKKIHTITIVIGLSLIALAIVLGPLAVELAQAAPSERPLYATCVVNTTADSGAGSLRECIENAGNGDTITFDTSTFPLGSPAAIAITSGPLPNITVSNLTIDGSNAGVIVDGSGAPDGTDCFVIDGASNVIIKGLRIVNCPGIGILIKNGATGNTIGGINGTPGDQCTGDCNLISGNGSDGVHIRHNGTMNNTVSGNYIGTNAAGTAAMGNADFGVTIEQGAQDNLIGGDTPGERNLISGSIGELGVSIRDSGSTNNTVSGNYIGTNASGTAAIGNALGGVLLGIGAQYNVIGGDTAGERNLISGNDGPGVLIEDLDTANNTISGNYIGTDVNGTADLGNGGDGVLLQTGASHNLIGGDTSGEGNLISGNDDDGVHLKGPGLMSDAPLLDDVSLTFNGGSNQLLNGNFSNGLLHWSTADDNPLSTRSINNVSYHSAPASYQFNRNGGFDTLRTWYDTLPQTVVLADPWNPASSNWIDVSPGTQVQLSFWYSGTLAAVEFWGRDSTGGDDELIKEVFEPTTTWTPVVLNTTIPGDIVKVGILFKVESDPPTTHNTISGNYIGTNASGTAGIANGENGVFINDGANNNLIGGDTAGERNIISGNTHHGISVRGSNTINNKITRNSIYNNKLKGINLDEGGNTELPAPIIDSLDINAGQVSGTACAFCTIEIFSDNEYEGKDYEDTRTADDSGNWSFSKGSAFTGPNVTATATDAAGNTSEFGTIFYIYLPLILRNADASIPPPPAGPELGHYTGTTPSVSFDVVSGPQVCNYDITVPFGAGSCRIQPPSCTTISNDTFTFTQSELGAIYTIDGAFDTETHTSGSYSVSMCEGSLILPPSAGTWEASK